MMSYFSQILKIGRCKDTSVTDYNSGNSVVSQIFKNRLGRTYIKNAGDNSTSILKCQL